MSVAIVGFLCAFALIFARVPVAIALALVGFLGYVALLGFQPGMTMLTLTASSYTLNYSLSVIPLFVLMGNLIAGAGVSHDLFRAAQSFVGRFKGGLAMATVISSGGFAAVSGSSVATAVTIGKIAIPSMRKFGYDDGLNTASVAAGATLGALLPPSITLVIYGIQTETSIGKLFAAGIIPGILGVLFYTFAVRWVVRMRPGSAPDATPDVPWSEKLAALKKTWLVVLLFAIVVGGIYTGYFTATEAGGIGAFGGFLVAIFRRVRPRQMFSILKDTAHTTGMLFALLVGAGVFSEFVNLTGASSSVLGIVTHYGVSPTLTIVIIVIIYIILGALMEELSMILLTLPMFFPLVVGLGYDPVWFGILVVMMVQLGLIVPPMALNLFIVQTIARDVPILTIFRGIVPFVCADIIRVGLIIAFPFLVLWLPGLLFG